MELLVGAFLNALTEGKIVCARQTPAGVMPKLKGPVTAVQMTAARAMEQAVYQYLGVSDEGVSLYGRKLEAEVRLLTICPRTLGSGKCSEQAQRTAELLCHGIAGVTIAGYTVGACTFDAQSDCFLQPVTAQVKAYLYATADEDETEFTDFMLKGEVR